MSFEWPQQHATCTLCAKVESPGFYTGCMIKDGECTDTGWQCDGNGNLTRPVPALSSSHRAENNEQERQ